MSFLLFCSGLSTFIKTVLKVTPFGKLLGLNSQQESKSADNPVAKQEPKLSIVQILFDYARQRVAVIIAQIILIAFFVLSGAPWWSYFVLWIAPIYFCVFLADEIRAFCDHAVPAMTEREADGYRLITFRPSWLEAIFLSPRNMNYHAEHHLWPGIPYYNLPEAHNYVRTRPEITIRGSYVFFLMKLFRSLPLEENAEQVSD